MKKRLLIIVAALVFALCGCAHDGSVQVVATTRPVYEFTSIICDGTDISVALLVTENVSCLHDYTLQVGQMKKLENAELIVCSGAGLEDFLTDIIPQDVPHVDCSYGLSLLCPEDHHGHDHDGHSHESDPHVWLDPQNAKQMALNICQKLCQVYPQHSERFEANLQLLNAKLDDLTVYGQQTLTDLRCRELITFHDGFSYFAAAFDLTILKAVEEESGAEASAAELIELISIVQEYDLPAIFTEVSGSTSAAQIISAETGAALFALDMGMSERGYFDTMYHNIDTIKEALR